MTASTKIQWRVQYRKSRSHKWVNAGLFETRKNAREAATWLRFYGNHDIGYGFGNTRVVRYVKGN
jgi:hypothetical protein